MADSVWWLSRVQSYPHLPYVLAVTFDLRLQSMCGIEYGARVHFDVEFSLASKTFPSVETGRVRRHTLRMQLNAVKI